MLIIISSVIIAIMLFLCSFLGFKQGLKLGMQSAKGIEPITKSPIAIIKEIVKEHQETKLEKELAEQEKKYNEGVERMMHYTGGDED